MNQSYSPPQLEVEQSYHMLIVDLTYPLKDMQHLIAHYAEVDAFTPRETLVNALAMLHLSFQHKEAVEAMFIEACIYRNDNWDEKVILHIEQLVRDYVLYLHQTFQQYRLYDETGELTHTLGGWVDEYTPYFIPRVALSQHAGAYDHRFIPEGDMREFRPHHNWTPFPSNDPEDSAIPWTMPSGVHHKTLR